MANGTDFTLSLFDNTALLSWNSHTLQAVTEPNATNLDEPDDADQDGETLPPSADPVAGGTTSTTRRRRSGSSPGWNTPSTGWMPTLKSIAAAASTRRFGWPVTRRAWARRSH